MNAASTSHEKDPNADVDPQILEALKSKDRLFVLRVGELVEGLINERKYVSFLFLIQSSSPFRRCGLGTVCSCAWLGRDSEALVG